MRTNYVILLLFITTSLATAQFNPGRESSIDSVFSLWSRPGSPGGSIGVMQNGELIYSKAFGLASLEYSVPNSVSTKFNIASISKQFTAMAIVRLHNRGILSVDDDIREYIPELPDFGYKITFRHMLHHTSGMRSLHMMLGIAGWRDDDSRTNDDLLRFMTRQKDLNFVPGDEYMYCNTGYILMAIAIERISGEKFPVWMEKEIFLPLGLSNTYVEEKYNSVVQGNATSYSGSIENGFSREVEYWGYTGSGNIHSTTGDLLKWLRYFYDSPEGWKDDFEMMKTVDTFNNGKLNNYAFGVNITKYKGENTISHSGSIGGFRANSICFPDRETEIVILTNFSSSDVGSKLNTIADIVLNLKAENRTASNSSAGRPDTKPEKQVAEEKLLLAIAGDYWSPELETQYTFSALNGTLEGYHNRHGSFSTEYMGDDTFESDSGFISKIVLVRNSEGQVAGMRVSNSRVRNLWMEKRY